MPTFMMPRTRPAENPVSAAVGRETKTLVKRVVLVVESEQDIAWLGRMKALHFDPILLTSNFDAVQMLNDDHELRLVLFAQRSAMMDGIAACQLLRQSRSETDIAIVLLLDDKLEESIVEAFAAGASDVVCQPFFAGELIARLDATLQRLLLWNDIESSDSAIAAAESSSTILFCSASLAVAFSVASSSIPNSAAALRFKAPSGT